MFYLGLSPFNTVSIKLEVSKKFVAYLFFLDCFILVIWPTLDLIRTASPPKDYLQLINGHCRWFTLVHFLLFDLPVI